MSGPARAWAAALVCALVVAGCGGGDSPDPVPPVNGKRSDRLVDFSLKPPYLNSLEIDPADGSFLLATNRGFFKIDRETKKVTEIRGKLTAEGKITTVGTFLAVIAARAGQARRLRPPRRSERRAAPSSSASCAPTTTASPGR